MKKIAFFLVLAWMPSLAFTYNYLTNNEFNPNPGIPNKFVSSAETDVLEWGCPIADIVEARSTGEAIEKMGLVCMADVRKAAGEKPGVFEVIQVSVLWPDLAIKRIKGGYQLEGTIFVETLVMKGMESR